MAVNAYCLLAACVYTSHTHITPHDVHPFHLSSILREEIREEIRSNSAPCATGDEFEFHIRFETAIVSDHMSHYFEIFKHISYFRTYCY